MSAAWELDIGSTDKLVLLALADWSNDDGICWPSIAQLCRKSGLSERAVQQSIKRLEVAKYLSRSERKGKGVTYSISLGKKASPARNAPPQQMPPADDAPPHETTQTPARRAPNTSVTTITSQKASPSSRSRASAKVKPSRLADDWRPVRFANETVARAVIDRRGVEWARAALESFRNWAANAEDKDGKGRKSDWQKAWGNWVIEQDKRDGRSNGNVSMAGHRSGSRSGYGSTVDAALAFVEDGRSH
jgi:DNA-binding transcriptional ArsR family regulator